MCSEYLPRGTLYGKYGSTFLPHIYIKYSSTKQYYVYQSRTCAILTVYVIDFQLIWCYDGSDARLYGRSSISVLYGSHAVCCGSYVQLLVDRSLHVTGVYGSSANLCFSWAVRRLTSLQLSSSCFPLPCRTTSPRIVTTTDLPSLCGYIQIGEWHNCHPLSSVVLEISTPAPKF